MLLDYVDVVVHIQHSDERNFYALDRLWKDCPWCIEVDGMGGPHGRDDRDAGGHAEERTSHRSPSSFGREG